MGAQKKIPMELASTLLDIVGKALIGAVTFFVYEIYSDFKELKANVNKYMIQTEVSSHDQELLRKEFDAFKTNIEARQQALEQAFNDEKINTK